MIQTTMDSGLAAFMFALVYGPTALLMRNIWAGIDDRLDAALEHARQLFANQSLPLSSIFKPTNQLNQFEARIHNGIKNYFAGSTTVDLSRPLHLLLSTPVFLWGATTLYKSEIWSQGTLPLVDFRVIFTSACLCFVISISVFLLQFWGFRKITRSRMSEDTD